MSLICVKCVDITMRVVEQYMYTGGHCLYLWKLHGLFLACSGIYLDNMPCIYQKQFQLAANLLYHGLRYIYNILFI